jgi:hypothetical protein
LECDETNLVEVMFDGDWEAVCGESFPGVEANIDVDEKTAVPVMKSCDALGIFDGVEDVLIAGVTADEVDDVLVAGVTADKVSINFVENDCAFF